MTSTKIKKGGLLLPNSSSLFPLVKSANKTLSTPDNIFSKDTSGTLTSKKGAFYNNYAKLATDVNTSNKKIGYHKLFQSSTATQSVAGGGKNKKKKEKKEKPRKGK